METGKTRRSYEAEFKRDAVKLVIDRGKSARSVGKGLGVNETIYK